jgi:hypothetical protein
MATVNKPTDVKQKEADVNRKLQVYGIIQAFKLGKAPSVSNDPARTSCHLKISSKAYNYIPR